MSATKHTPGPWKASALRGSAWSGFITGADGKEIAVMTADGTRQETEGEPHDPDAVLIAAAPELLEAALVRVSHGHNDTCDIAKINNPAEYPCTCGHDALVAAVKSARGES